ncbi:MAG: hypothetical protein U0103_03965 [Candidatus Obscuribacterales bacterium]
MERLPEQIPRHASACAMDLASNHFVPRSVWGTFDHVQEGQMKAKLTARRKTSTDKLVRPVIYLSATLLVSHLIYMIFNASPRQAFTSMPFIVLPPAMRCTRR